MVRTAVRHEQVQALVSARVKQVENRATTESEAEPIKLMPSRSGRRVPAGAGNGLDQQNGRSGDPK